MDCSPEAPLSMVFSRQEYWNRLSFSPPADLPNPGIEPMSLLHSQAGSLPIPPPGKPNGEMWEPNRTRWWNTEAGTNLVVSGENEAVSVGSKDGRLSWQRGELQREAELAVRKLCILPERPRRVTKDFKHGKDRAKLELLFCITDGQEVDINRIRGMN